MTRQGDSSAPPPPESQLTDSAERAEAGREATGREATERGEAERDEAVRDETGREAELDGAEPGSDDSGAGDWDDLDAPAPVARTRAGRWPLLALGGAVAACLALWQSSPAQREVTIRIAASARVEQVEVTWLHEGEALRASRHNFDGQAIERKVQSRLNAEDGQYQLQVRIAGEAGTSERTHLIKLGEEGEMTVFAP